MIIRVWKRGEAAKAFLALAGGVLGLICLVTIGCTQKTAVATGSAIQSPPKVTSAVASTSGTKDRPNHPSAFGPQPPPGSAMPPGGPKIPAQFGGK